MKAFEPMFSLTFSIALIMVLAAAESQVGAASPQLPLTAADVRGPDGIVYPDWHYAGIAGGIPKIPGVAAASEFGARPDDDQDDSDALQKAAEHVGTQGGGAVLLEAGSYYLDRPVVITLDNTVIRGAGPEKTRLIFRFNGPSGERAMRAEYLGRPIEANRVNTGNVFGAINFCGKLPAGPMLLLAKDGARGDIELELQTEPPFKPGDAIVLEIPEGHCKSLAARIGKDDDWRVLRRYEFQVEGVTGKTVRLNQPLRQPYPVMDGSYVQAVTPIRRCGVESLSLEQTTQVWTSGFVFASAWECWIKEVQTQKCGQHPVVMGPAKWCEVRDCRFADAWFKGGGGTAYVGFFNAWDCLMENVHAEKLRHGPDVQDAAAGNVIRKCIFMDSDGQWHGRWANENLFEQLVIQSREGHGSYGDGLWSSGPEHEFAGGEGPRNVIYNCDITGQHRGVVMNGWNEGWLFLHNRIICGSPASCIFAKENSDGHLFSGNVFVLRDKRSPLVEIRTPDCEGIRVVGNTVYGGNGVVGTGQGRLAEDKDNVMQPLTSELPARPQPAVPSIFEWQRAQMKP